MTAESKKRLVLLDAHAIIHRAYHALPDFSTSRGEPTGALYGLMLMILKIASDLTPDYIVACYDLPKPTYRHEVYDGYKAGRKKTDDDLAVQLEESKRICEAMNIPIYAKEGFEADDLLGTIAEAMRDKNVDIIIASGDMDTMQLIDDGNEKSGSIKVYTLKKGIKDTILYDEKAVKERYGFEPKLLADFKGLRGDPSDNIIGIKGIGEKSATDLIKSFGGIEEIYKEIKNPKSKIKSKIKPRTLKLLEDGEEEAKFSKMLATIRKDAPINFNLPSEEWKRGIDVEKAEKIFQELEFRTMGSKLKDLFDRANGGGEKDAKKEEKINAGVLEETKIALWIVDSNITNPGLEDILNFANANSFEKAREAIFAELKKRESENVFENIEKPLMPIIKKMEERGVLIDKLFLGELNREYSKELENIKKEIWKEAGIEFNISSPKQLSEILFDKLGIGVKYQKKTATGGKSTKESELQKIADKHPIIQMVLEYRELSKLISTYIEPIPKMIDGGGRLHARFIQTGTTTGRMSSQNPNLQNIPTSSERGSAIRRGFVAPKNFSLVAFDYSQIELRIAAFLSGDEKFIRILKSGEDIHTGVASYVFEVSASEVSREMRRKAKVINFGILYGMGVNALAQNLKSDRKTAQKFYNDYFEKFPGLAKYLDRVKADAERNGYTKTFFGRRRYLDGLKSKIPYIKAAAERMAINAPIQGTSADIIKIAMRQIDDYIMENRLNDKVFLILQIHDELIYEVSKDCGEKVLADIKEIMESVLPPEKISDVPIVVNISAGDDWGNIKKL